ncbi:MAG: hypothetical protein ABI780_11300 [Ardenticatenales bacterium]
MTPQDARFLDLLAKRRPGMVTDVRAILGARYGRSVRLARPRGSVSSIFSFHHSATPERVGVEGALASTWDYHIRVEEWFTGGYANVVTQDGHIYVCALPFSEMTYNAGARWNPITTATCAVGYFHAPNNNVPTAELLQSLYAIGISLDDASGVAGGRPWRPHRALKQTACPGDILTPHIWRMTGVDFAAAEKRPEVYTA